jgi:hypothetical protein
MIGTRMPWVLRWLSIFAFLTPVALAQVQVSGRVTNENNLPIAGALIQAHDIPTTKTWEAISDPTGEFILELPTAGKYSLKVDHEGFYIVSESLVTVPDKTSQPVDIHISLQSIYQINSSIDVTGQAGLADMDRVTPQSTLSSRTLYDVPFPNQNSLRSGLRTIPEVVQDNSGGIHLFGGSEDQAQYSFEGFQLNDPLTGRFEARMSLDAIESIDVQPSPSDADMGRGSAGAMLLHARTGTDNFRFSFTQIFPGIDFGNSLRPSTWTPRAYVAGPLRKGRAWYFNSGELQYNRNKVLQLPVNQNYATSWRFNDLLHTQINLSERNFLFIGLLYDYQYSPHAGLTNLDPFETTTRRHFTQWMGYLKDQHSLARSSMIEAGFAASFTHNTADPQGNSPYLITPGGREGNYYATSRLDAQRLQGIVNYVLPAFHFWGEHRLKTGGDIVHIDYQQNIIRTTIDYLNNAGAIVRAVNFSGSGSLHDNTYEDAFYIQDSWRFRPWLLFEMGWRADQDRLVGRWNSSPRAGFSITPAEMEKTRISGSFARIVEPSNLQLFTRPLDQTSTSTYYDSFGNPIYGPVTSVFTLSPHLRNPYSDIWTLGVEQSLPAALQAKVELLRRRFSDGFDFTDNLPSILSGVPNPGPVTADYLLTNQRQDHYNSVTASLRQPLKGRFEWMVSYTHSQADSNAVIARTIDQPLSVVSNNGPLPWDAPNRLVSWGYLPAWKKVWAIAYMMDWHTGLPFSIQDPYGQLVGAPDSKRFPAYFQLNIYVERIVTYRGYRVAFRTGFNNITGHFDPTVIDNVVGGSTYLRAYGSQPRALNFQLRFLGQH